SHGTELRLHGFPEPVWRHGVRLLVVERLPLRHAEFRRALDVSDGTECSASSSDVQCRQTADTTAAAFSRPVPRHHRLWHGDLAEARTPPGTGRRVLQYLLRESLGRGDRPAEPRGSRARWVVAATESLGLRSGRAAARRYRVHVVSAGLGVASTGIPDTRARARLCAHQPRRTRRAEPALWPEFRALPVRSEHLEDERSRDSGPHRTGLRGSHGRSETCSQPATVEVRRMTCPAWVAAVRGPRTGTPSTCNPPLMDFVVPCRVHRGR